MLTEMPPLTLTFDDVLLLPAASNVLPSEVDLSARLTRRIQLKIPLLSAAMDTVTEARMAIAMARMGGLGVIHRNLTLEQQADAVRGVKLAALCSEPDEDNPMAVTGADGKLLAAAAIGTGTTSLERAEALLTAGCDVIVVDTAHGHSLRVIDTVRALRQRHPQLDIIAGNVATADATTALIDAGADGIKVGIGPGSICTTRVIAGVGVPQLSAVGDAAAAAQDRDVPVIADGGIKHSGDVVKAIGAGASTAMMGSLFGGTDEAPGELVWEGEQAFKRYRGMGSVGAMQRGSAERYFQAGTPTQKLIAEGVEAKVPYRGPLAEVVHQLLGGLRAGMGYTGSPDIETLRREARFTRISNAGLRESQVHDVIPMYDGRLRSPR